MNLKQNIYYIHRIFRIYNALKITEQPPYYITSTTSKYYPDNPSKTSPLTSLHSVGNLYETSIAPQIENEEEEGDIVSNGKGQRDTRNGPDKEDIKGGGQSEVEHLDATCSDEFPEDFDFDDNLWGVDDNDEEERGRKRDKEAEYHLFVKTHQKRRHRGTRHRARSSI